MQFYLTNAQVSKNKNCFAKKIKVILNYWQIIKVNNQRVSVKVTKFVEQIVSH